MKPGQLVAADAELELEGPPRYVSRGGVKLENALAALPIDVEGRDCLDVGASTGGFTDCLLRHGAARVIALDVAHGQLDWGLRNDPRVHIVERSNARELDPSLLPWVPSLATIDVSFISLRKVLPAVADSVAAEGVILALVKPQFELGRERVGRGGVVRDQDARREALLAVAMPDGGTAEREVVEHDNAVGVVAIDPDGKVVLLRHYRHPVRERQLEIPAGKLDVEGEAPIDAARRELLEEVGLDAASLTPLIHFYNSAGWSDEATTVYFTDDVVPGDPADDFTAEHEESDLEVVRMDLDAALAAVDSGQIRDAKTVIGVLLAARKLANRR